MWSWNVLGVALWVAVIVYLVFVIKNIRQRRLKMIITRQRTFEVKNFLLSCLEVAVLLVAIAFLGWETLFKKPDLTDRSQVESRVTYHALVLEPSAVKSYYVKEAAGSYAYYINGKSILYRPARRPWWRGPVRPAPLRRAGCPLARRPW